MIYVFVSIQLDNIFNTINKFNVINNHIFKKYNRERERERNKVFSEMLRLRNLYLIWYIDIIFILFYIYKYLLI